MPKHFSDSSVGPVLSATPAQTIAITTVSSGHAPIRSTSVPTPLYPASSLSDPPMLQHSPELSLEDRKRELALFETVMIKTGDQLREFEELYEKGFYNIDNGLFQSWLPLKIKAQGNERKAFQFILRCRTPK